MNTEIRTAVITAASAAAQTFTEEFPGERLAATSDWDSGAWEIDSAGQTWPNEAWELYQETLRVEIDRLTA
jgi:hypothetical protein